MRCAKRLLCGRQRGFSQMIQPQTPTTILILIAITIVILIVTMATPMKSNGSERSSRCVAAVSSDDGLVATGSGTIH